MEKTKLILGSAGKSHPDALTVDIDGRCDPDIVYDLNKTPWPFLDKQFTEIVCHHVLEHLLDLTVTLKELHRICSDQGQIYIEVPHFSSWMAHDPAHKMSFSFFSLDPYIVGRQGSWKIIDDRFSVLEHRITFHRAFRRYGFHCLWNKYPLTYERFWTYIMPAEHLIWRLRPIKSSN